MLWRALQEITFAGGPAGTVPAYTFTTTVVPEQLAGHVHVNRHSPGAIAAGDLDGVMDENGNRHDEIALVTENHPLGDFSPYIALSVVDYAVEPGAATMNASVERIPGGTYPYLPRYGSPANTLWPGMFAVTIGDFDGEAGNEIAVVMPLIPEGNACCVELRAYVYKYRPGYDETPPVGGRLELLDARSLPRLITLQGPVEIDHGALDGDGNEEIAVLYRSDPVERPELFLVVVDWNTDTGKLEVPITQPAGDYEAWSTGSRIDARVATGLFKFDPGLGYPLTRRQVAVARVGPFRSVRETALWDFTSPHSPVNPSAQWTARQYTSVSVDGHCSSSFTTFSLVAGNFVGGNASSPNPLWGLAQTFKRQYEAGTDVVLFRVDQNIDPKSADGPLTLGGAARAPTVITWCLPVHKQVLAAFDADGNSILLGAPVHFQLHDQIRTNYVLHEPPKHTAWLNDQVVDVSRKFNFYVDLQNEQGVTLDTKSTDASDWNFGGSKEISAKATATANIGIVTVEASLEVEHIVGEDYDEHQEDYDSSYRERTLTFIGQTNADDFIVADLQLLDLWRYRVYGTTATGPGGEELNAFYDLLLPGPMVELRGSGLTLDWYQPVHENGNILSYPPITNNTFAPPDLGSFTLPDGTERREPLVPATLLDTGGASGIIALKFSEASGGGSARSTSNKMTESLDIKIGVSVRAEFPGFTGEAGAAVAWNAHESNSEAASKTSDWTSSQSTSITLSKPAGDTAHAYRFAPVFYVTQDGTLKVTHAVDPLGVSAATFWPATYGKKPDPALNLPLRFSPT